jgi:hypothetical protein
MNYDFIILTDTRQKSENHITKNFDKQGIIHIRTGLPSADYMALRYEQGKGFYLDYSVLIDTKKDLLELCGNLTKDHDRLVREIDKGHELGCEEFVFIIGDTKIKTIEDIKKWSSPHTKVKGYVLLKIMQTFKEHHNCKFVIVPKKEVGNKVIDLLSKK